ncbi:MAG: hypothetical protein DHS80DRAFT_33258 [Piptocephalis tieghemiana]|nr:MAG: hypothetical protein DHS80DRAFT_33258 [Piptocephalis tieghemiana]
MIWPETLSKVASQAEALRDHHLTLRGRVLAIKALLLSRVWYVALVIPPGPGDLKRLEKLVWAYLWKGRTRGLVKRETCRLPVRQGGLGMPSSPQKMIESRLITWITRFHTHPSGAWQRILTSRMTLPSLDHRPPARINPFLQPRSPLKLTALPCPWPRIIRRWRREGGDIFRLSFLSPSSLSLLPMVDNPNLALPGPIQRTFTRSCGVWSESQALDTLKAAVMALINSSSSQVSSDADPLNLMDILASVGSPYGPSGGTVAPQTWPGCAGMKPYRSVAGYAMSFLSPLAPTSVPVAALPRPTTTCSSDALLPPKHGTHCLEVTNALSDELLRAIWLAKNHEAFQGIPVTYR